MGAANSAAQVTSKATAWQEIACGFVDPENQKYVSVVAAHQDVLSEMLFWHGNIANKLAGWKLDEPLKLDPNLSEHNMAWLSKLSVNDLATKLRLKWSDIKGWYTTPSDRWAASGQNDTNVCISNYMSESTPHRAVVQYLHCIVYDKQDLLDFATKTLSMRVCRDAAPRGIDPVTGQPTAREASASVSQRLAARCASCTPAKQPHDAILAQLGDSLDSLGEDTDADISIAKSIESLATSAKLEALIKIGQNQNILTSPQKKKYRDNMSKFLETLDF